MSISKLDQLATLTRQGQTVAKAIPLMADSHCVFPLLAPGANVVLSLNEKRDGTFVEHYDKELHSLPTAEAVGVLSNLAKAGRTIEAACASIIGGWLTSFVGVSDWAADTESKGWSDFKKAREQEFENQFGITRAKLSSIQQWANYWSVARKAIRLGFPLSGWFYKGKDGSDCVVSRSMLLKFCAENGTKKDKLESACEKLEALAVALTGGKKGDSEWLLPEVTIDPKTAEVFATLALGNMDGERVAMVAADATTPGTMIAEMVRRWGFDTISGALEAYRPEKEQAAA